MYLRWLCLAILLLIVPLTVASPKPWMKARGDPEELPVFIFDIVDCPMTKADVDGIVHGVLIRSRLKKVNATRASLQLWINAQCKRVSPESANYLFNLEVEFGSYSEALGHFRLGETGYGSYGINDGEYIKGAIRSAAEKAVMDYLQVNFDL